MVKEKIDSMKFKMESFIIRPINMEEMSIKKVLLRFLVKHILPNWIGKNRCRYPHYAVDLDANNYFDSFINQNNLDEIF